MAKRLIIRVDLENAAFEDNPNEVSYIFRQIEEKIKLGLPKSRVFDSNGNDVGSFCIEPDINSLYEYGVCPDCQEPIPNEVEEGESCNNCGHVFTNLHPNDYI